MTNKEIIQISKSKPKKISILCTLKLYLSLGLALAPAKYIPRVPQCLSPRPNWDPPSPASESAPRNQRGGGHTRLRVRGWGSQFGRLKNKPSTLSTLW